ncbi:MAG: threonine synthase [Bacillota bacterium]|nr:threonine synthase [Bacillota bacterium]
MKYHSTRGRQSVSSAAEAITRGLASDGGLFVPDRIPRLSEEDWAAMENETYQERACRILAYYLDDFSSEEIRDCVYGAYNDNQFDDPRIAPLVFVKENLVIQELWHGPTCAFKDMALQILPHLLTTSAAKIEEKSEIVILVATSGDTGKAALEGFKDVPGTRIIVFFPEDGVSEVQKRQMLTQEGENVHVAAVYGNFDDAQTGVKSIFSNSSYTEILGKNQMKMSSANSINWGRLLPQIVYYVSAYMDLKAEGTLKGNDPMNIVVPTGNFGNILAAFYARQMGVPIQKLICASNANNVLTDFIHSGVYDRNRNFAKTISPSMDILISSNLERLLYELTGHDDKKVSGWMEALNQDGRYEVDEATKQQIQNLFWADFADDEKTIEMIQQTWAEDHYLMDTHTAVARKVYERYAEETGDETPAVIVSTASPYKFGNSVAQAVLSTERLEGRNEFEVLTVLSEQTGTTIPVGIRDLEKRPILHHTKTAKEEMGQTILDFLGL